MCICFLPSSTVFARRGLTCRFLCITLCSANKYNYIITKLKVDYKYSFLFFFFNYTASWNNAAIKATVSQPQYQGDVGYGAAVNSLSFSSVYILQLSSTKAFSENWWQFRIYWIPVDKNTLSEVLEIIVFCVFNNPGNCWLVLTTSLLCFEPPSSADVCPGGGEGRAALSLSLQPTDPLQVENPGECKGQCKVLAAPWELIPCAAPSLTWRRSAPAAPSPRCRWRGEHHGWLGAVLCSVCWELGSNIWHFQS